MAVADQIIHQLAFIDPYRDDKCILCDQEAKEQHRVSCVWEAAIHYVT